MATILVISPDPEARRMLQLAFELGGLSIQTAIDPADARAIGAKPDGILLDLIDGGPEQWDLARRAHKLFRAPTALLLPRGWDGKKAPKGISEANLVIRKPYELLDVIRQVKGMAAAAGPAPRKTPSKKKPAARPKKQKAKRR